MRKQYILSLLALSAPSLVMALGYGDYMQSDRNPRYYYNAPTPQDYGPSPQEGYYDPQTHRLDGGYYYYAPQNIRPGYPGTTGGQGFYYNQPSGQGQFTEQYPSATYYHQGGLTYGDTSASNSSAMPSSNPSSNFYVTPSNQGSNTGSDSSNFYYTTPSNQGSSTNSDTGNRFFYSQPGQPSQSTTQDQFVNPASAEPKTTSSWWNWGTTTNTATATSTDTELQTQVTNALSNFPNVTARVSEGVVTLTGTINNNQDRVAIKNRVFGISGVRNVEDRLEFRNSNAISATESSFSQGTTTNATRRPFQQDNTIFQNVRSALKKGILSKGYENLEIKVYNGTVTLSGTVDTTKDLRDIKGRVFSVPGVNDVVTAEIKVRSPSAA